MEKILWNYGLSKLRLIENLNFKTPTSIAMWRYLVTCKDISEVVAYILSFVIKTS